MAISVHVLTKNSASTLAQTLLSLQPFPEVIVWDTGSTDETLKIASQFKNVIIHQASLIGGFGKAHNEAAARASNEWILSVDSDEVLSPGLAEELLSMRLDPHSVYSIERENYFNGKHLRCCAGWYPDWVIRLYNRKSTSFSNDIVHEKVVSEGFKVVQLKHPLKHVPYRSIADFLDKMQIYSSLFALQYKGLKRPSFMHAVFHGLGAFIKSYFLKRGVFGGRAGFIISLYNAQTAYYKYLKLIELNKNL
jgi:glycosyltransferase involved in cell wall biosynthesis